MLERMEYLEQKEGKNVILCGDFNVAPTRMDMFHPYELAIGLPGFLPEEREWMSKMKEAGYIDVFRHFNPDVEDVYTVWDMKRYRRIRNEGWRIDLFMVKRSLLLKPSVVEGGEIDLQVTTSRVLPEILGSDHCPIDLVVATSKQTMFCSAVVPKCCAKFLSQFALKDQKKLKGNTPSIMSFFAPVTKFSGSTDCKSGVKIGLKREREVKSKMK